MSIRYPSGRITLSINSLLVPDAPASATATASTATTASVAFTAPTNVGGGAITGYAVVPSVGGTVVSATTSPATVTGLSAGTSYTFQVTALNSYGPGPIITSNSITTPSLITYLTTDMYNAAGGNASSNWAITSDSSGNIYVSGRQKYTGVTVDYYVAKLTSAGVMTWQRALNGGGEYDYSYDIVLDSSGNVYTCGYTNASQYSMLVTKYNSSGTLQWQRGLGDGNVFFEGRGIALDSSNNVFVVSGGVTGSFPSNNYGIIMKLDGSTGAKLAQRYFRVSSETNNNQLTIRGVAVDSSNDVFISGSFFDQVNPAFAVLAKYNNTLTTQAWNIRLAGATTITCGLDSSGNMYAAGGSSGNAYIVKINSAGVVQWQKSLNYSAFSISTFSCAVHSSGDVYGVCPSGNPINGHVVYKLNSSGVLQWARIMNNTTGNGNGPTTYGISVSDSGTALYLSGQFDATATSGGPQNSSIWVFPANGTKTGTYTVNGRSFSWTAITLTESTPTITPATWTFADPGGTWLSNTLSLTDSAGALTTAVTVIP